MGDMTRGEMQTELGYLFGNKNDAGFTDNTRQERWLTWAYRYMTHPSVHSFRETQATYDITLATDDGRYGLDATTVGYQILAVRWASHIQATSYSDSARRRKLHPRDIRWFMERTISSGQPTIYTIDGEELLTWGIPRSNENGQILRLGVYREIADFAGDSATTAVPAYFDRPLLKLAQAFAESDLGDRDSALVTMREVVALLNGAQEEGEMEGEDTGWRAEFVTSRAMGPM